MNSIEHTYLLWQVEDNHSSHRTNVESQRWLVDEGVMSFLSYPTGNTCARIKWGGEQQPWLLTKPPARHFHPPYNKNNLQSKYILICCMLLEMIPQRNKTNRNEILRPANDINRINYIFVECDCFMTHWISLFSFLFRPPTSNRCYPQSILLLALCLGHNIFILTEWPCCLCWMWWARICVDSLFMFVISKRNKKIMYYNGTAETTPIPLMGFHHFNLLEKDFHSFLNS